MSWQQNLIKWPIAPASPNDAPNSAVNTEGEAAADQARFTGNVIDGDIRNSRH